MVYGSYSRGFKAGGFNLDREQAVLITPTGPNFTADPNTAFRGEYVDSFEIGTKLRLFDGSLLFNAAAFNQTFTDFQLNTFVGTAFIVETLPEVISKGIDADFNYASPIDGLTFQGGVTYAETTISEFTAADLLVASRFNSLRRLPGAQLSFAPKVSVSLAGNYETPIGAGLMFKTNVTAKYLSEYNTGSDLHPSKASGGLHPGQRPDRHRFGERPLDAGGLGPEPDRPGLSAGRLQRPVPGRREQRCDQCLRRLPRGAADIRSDATAHLLIPEPTKAAPVERPGRFF
jgi:outer membrane receptor protein involved in Fe transport